MYSFFHRMAALLAAAVLLFSAFPALAQEDETVNILLIGVDTDSADEAGRSDAMMLVQIAPESGDVRLVSFLRDLYVSIPGQGKNRLNAAYFYGGEALLKRTLEENFGVRIDRFVTVHFSLMAELIDLAGGVEIEVTAKELSQLNDIIKRYNMSTGAATMNGVVDGAGLHRLNGKQALSFSRIRKIDSDFQRTSRQHQVLLALLEQLHTLDFFTLSRLALTALQKVETDLSLGDVRSLFPLVNGEETPAIRTAHVPFDGTYTDETINDMMVLVPNLQKNTSLLRAFLTEE